MLPDRKFSLTQRSLIVVTLPKGGITPVREFCWRSTLVRTDELANKASGMSPVRLLCDRIIVLIEELLANETGKRPLRLLFARST
jgi:hypothetical protein